MFNLKKISIDDNQKQIVRPFLCDQIKQFGFCKGPCLERHFLCKRDKEYHNIPTKCFISVQVTEILTASRFIGRILKYSTAKNPIKDQHWISVNNSFENIKNELQLFSLLPETKIVHTNPIIGELVMIETERKELFRAIVLDIVNGWFSIKVKVTLMDLGHMVEISSNKIFVLPNHLKEIPPIAVEIIISSIEPIGEGGISILNWPLATTNLVRSLLEPIILNNLELICKVEIALGITFWVDWMLVKKCIKCSHFICELHEKSLKLPKELIERNLAKQNSLIINKLIDLSKDAQIWKEDISIDKSSMESIKQSNKTLFSCEEKEIKIDKLIKEIQWAHLSKNIIYNVSVERVEHPKCFLVRNMKFLRLLNDLQRDINKAIEDETVTQLTCATEGTVCLAVSPNENKIYNRAIIKQINDYTANIFYVDYGEYYKVQIESLLSIPENLITKLPFQVIECKLSGFNDILEPDVLNQFNNCFLQLTDEIHLKVLSISMDSEITGGNLYEVVLFNNDLNVNVKMANEFNMVIEVDNTQIQNILSLNLKFNEYESEEEEETIEEDEINNQIALLKTLIKKSNETEEKQIILNTQDLSSDVIVNKSIETNEKQIGTNLEQCIILNKKQNIMHEKHIEMKIHYCLECNVIPVIPKCYWHQDDTWIYLNLNILLVNNYSVQHTMDTITINIVTDSVTYHLTLVLYAYIVEELFKCHINFDGICIKAKKLIQVKYNWPRLVKCSKKHKYILYNTDYLTGYKDWSLWLNIMNKFKIMALAVPLNVDNCNSESDSSNSDQNTIFED